MVQLTTEKTRQVDKVNNSFLLSTERVAKKLAEKIYQYFLNYFQAVDKLERVSFKNKYCISGILFNQIVLINSKGQKSVSIYHNQALHYHAVCHPFPADHRRGLRVTVGQNEEQWIETKNSLSTDELKKIQLLPQTEEAVVQEYLARYLAKYLLDNLTQLNSSKEIIWKLADENGQFQVYTFSLTCCSQNKSTLILGRNSNGGIIFQAEIVYYQVINITENKISKKNLSQFVNWCMNHSQVKS
jgi:hypothetical protein